MVRLAICDDDSTLSVWLRDVAQGYLASAEEEHEVTVYGDARELLADMKCGRRFQVLFLDILFPSASGIEAAREIRRMDKTCILVFITSSPDYALDGYSVKAFDYLVKPVDSARLSCVLRKALEECGGRIGIPLAIKSMGIDITLNSADITYIESAGHYVVFHASNGTQYSRYGKLDDCEKSLERVRSYARCHQSYLINLDYVQRVEGRDFILHDGRRIPIRKSGAAGIKREYYEYVLKKSNDGICV